MDLRRYFALDAHWYDHPSVRDMVQAYMGIKPAARLKTIPQNDQADVDEFVKMFQSIGGTIG